MKIIYNNHFRVAGISSNASVKGLQKPKSRVKAYNKIGKELSFDFDYSMFTKVKNSIATILFDMDSEIVRQLAKYKQVKQGLIQNLLMGKIRLV